MKKRIILTTLLLAALFALCMSAYATEYDLWVGGVRITDTNASDVFGDGKVSYDDATNTLTLDNYSYDGESSGIDVYADLTINLVGSSSLTVTNSGYDGISLRSSAIVTFTGSGSLTINAEYGIYSYDELYDCEIINNASGTISILSENPISDSITVTGSGSFNINDSGFAEGVRVGGVKLDPGKYIDTDGNVSDTMPSGGYAYLSGDSSTLTLNNYSYTGPGFMFDEYSEDYAIIYAEHALTIEVKGTNTLRSTVDTCIGGPAHFSIVGDGTLNLYSVRDAVNNDYNDDYDIYDIIITDCTLNIESGNEGIDADNDLHINGNAKVTVTAMVGDAVYAEDEMIIEDNAVVLVKYAEDDGLESEDDDTYIRGNARVTVEAAGDEGIEADDDLYIQDNAVVIIGASGDAGLLFRR